MTLLCGVMDPETRAYYDGNSRGYSDSTMGNDLSDTMSRFLGHMRQGGRILDLGCGSGRDTVFLEEEGCVVTPMDGSEKMCNLASIHTGKEVLHLRIEEMEFSNVFHGIWACAVLGHFPPEEIYGVMERILAALKEDGILYFSVRRGDRKGRFNGRYFYDYNRESLNALLDAFPEIQVLDIWKTSDVREDRNNKWFNVLLKKQREEE